MIDFTRNRHKQPMIIPRGGRKRVPYRRFSSYAAGIEDESGLVFWGRRTTAEGLAKRPDFLPLVTAHADAGNKRALDDIVERAMDAAGANVKSEMGTYLHHLVELVNTGQPLPLLGPRFVEILDGYLRLMRDEGLRVLPDCVERRVVCDAMLAAGTPDMVVEHEGVNYIGDLKTGGISLGKLKIAAQLALPARGGEFYDPATDEREAMPDLDQNWGIVIHLPQDGTPASAHWFDLNIGMRAVHKAQEIREMRKIKNVSMPLGAR